MGPAKDAKGGERREVRSETATPRRVSVRCWMTVTGTWNLSIYCNRSGMPSITHVTSRDPTLDAVGTRSCVIRRGTFKKRATAIFDLSLRVDLGCPENRR